MKIDWKSKNTKITVIVLAIIVIPILFNQIKSMVTGMIAAYQMSLPVEVEVANPEKRVIYEEYETTGRIVANYSLNVIARVEGWLEKRFFEEGDKVKKGQKLFQIEPNEYILATKNAQARVNENRAVYNNAQIELRRAKSLIKEDFVSQEYYDNAIATRNQTKGALDASVAELNKARLNLSYTNITAPFDGRVGKIEITEGNYVTAASGNLTTVYTTNPMKVTFTLKSSDFLAIKKYLLESKDKLKKIKDGANPITVKLKLADGSIYNKFGKIEFIDNNIDETTGNVTLRAIFENPDEILVPGDYVNVILKANQTSEVMLVPQSATKTDVGTGYYVWVVKNDGTVEKRDIVVTDTIDNNWVVKEGLNYNDTIVVNGIQNVYHSGQKIKIINNNKDANAQTTQGKKSIKSRIKNKLKKLLKGSKA